MNPSIRPLDTSAASALWFQSLTDPQRGFEFPCDAQGRVDLDCLSELARDDYFLARALIGHDYAYPTVVKHAGPSRMTSARTETV